MTSFSSAGFETLGRLNFPSAIAVVPFSSACGTIASTSVSTLIDVSGAESAPVRIVNISNAKHRNEKTLTRSSSSGQARRQRTLDLLMMMEMSHKECAPGAAVVTLAGKVTMGAESEQILGLVDNLLREGKRTIVFDIAGVNHIDSTGIGRFISSYHKISAAGGDMRMAGATGVLFQAFHVSMLDTVFRFFPDVEAACKPQ